MLYWGGRKKAGFHQKVVSSCPNLSAGTIWSKESMITEEWKCMFGCKGKKNSSGKRLMRSGKDNSFRMMTRHGGDLIVMPWAIQSIWARAPPPLRSGGGEKDLRGGSGRAVVEIEDSGGRKSNQASKKVFCYAARWAAFQKGMIGLIKKRE